MALHFRNFLIKMFSQLATGNFTVVVENNKGEKFPADVIGYSEEYMTVHVRYHSDNLTKPGTKQVPRASFGYGTEEEYNTVEIQVPVKTDHIFYTSVKLN